MRCKMSKTKFLRWNELRAGRPSMKRFDHCWLLEGLSRGSQNYNILTRYPAMTGMGVQYFEMLSLVSSKNYRQTLATVRKTDNARLELWRLYLITTSLIQLLQETVSSAVNKRHSMIIRAGGACNTRISAASRDRHWPLWLMCKRHRQRILHTLAMRGVHNVYWLSQVRSKHGMQNHWLMRRFVLTVDCSWMRIE